MSRPESIDLRGDVPWRPVPMPGANLPLDLVPLASAGSAFTILGRFPAGFVRASPGGYAHAEEFVVLEGSLDLEGLRHESGSIVHVPAGFLRTDMRTERGCTVFAWFGGPAEFLAPEALIVTGEGITSVSVTDLSSNRWESSQSRWRLASLSDREPGEEIIDPMAGRWWRTGEPTVADLAESVLLRAPR